jgi:hypothetical protein
MTKVEMQQAANLMRNIAAYVEARKDVGKPYEISYEETYQLRRFLALLEEEARS